MCGSYASTGAQKNGLRSLRTGAEGVVRSADAAGSRPAERGVSDLSGTRSAARRMPQLWRREARTAGLPGGQSALHQTLCVLCRSPLPAGIDPRYRQGTRARLGDSQDAGDAVHAGSAYASRHARSASDRHRRDLGAQRTTVIASWSATWIASGPSGSAERIVPKPPWQHSTIGWGRETAVKSSLP